MMREKKSFAHPENSERLYTLYHRGEDMEYRWAITYYIDGVRKHHYGNMNGGKCYAERYDRALLQLDILYERHSATAQKSDAHLAALYFLKRKSKNWADSTVIDYTFRVRHFFGFLKGRQPSPRLVKQYMAILESTIAPATYNKALDLVRNACKEGGYGFCFHNIDRLKVNSQPHFPYQRMQQEQLRKRMELHDPQLLLFCQFIYYTFLRPKEILSTRVGDILWDESNIRIRGVDAKNNKYDRAAIPKAFLDTVYEHYAERAPGEYLFPAMMKYREEKPLGKNTMGRRHRLMLRKLNYGDNYTMYSWRHTGAVEALKAGTPIMQLSILMRHHSVEQTVTYAASLGFKDVDTFRENMRPFGQLSL